MDKLKPCPFCGGEALDYSSKTVQCDYGYNRRERVCVYCEECNTYGPRVLTEKVRNHAYPREYVNIDMACEKAAEAWNRRC